MGHSTVSQVLDFASKGSRYVRKSFGLDADTAADVIQDVLLRLLRSHDEPLDNPKRYFFRACRWQALQVLRRRRHQEEAHRVLVRRQETALTESEVLVALEDEDKPKFFEEATPKQQEVLELIMEGHSQEEISAILQIPSSTVRMRVQLSRKKLGHGVG